MIVALVLVALVAAGLAVVALRLRSELEAVTEARDALEIERNTRAAEALAASGRAEDAVAERDAALERVQRARRDASEVARRLAEETAARKAAETEVEEVRRDVARFEAELAEVRAELEAASAAGGGTDVEQLWSLALASVERLWQTSVAPAPGSPSPLVDAADPLRAAVEIVVDAAHEEAGAAVELQWTLDEVLGADPGLRVLATVQEAVAAVAKTASRAELVVEEADGSVRVRIDAVDDDGAPLPVALPG